MQLLRQPPPPFVDISVESKPFYFQQVRFHVTVTNNLRAEFSAQTVRNVQVQIEPKVLSSRQVGAGRFDGATGIWTIPRIEPGGSVEADFALPRRASSYEFESFGDLTPVRFSATLVPGSPKESRGFELNNTTEQWFMIDENQSPFIALGDAGVDVTVDNRVPQEGGRVVFGVRHVSSSRIGYVAGLGGSAARNRINSVPLGTKVSINVSEGLQFAPGLQPPMGTTFDDDTMIWDVGNTLVAVHAPTLDVPVVVSQSPSLAELPLEQRCLTAEVVEVLPAYELDPRWRLNDVFTLCLGQRPAVISDGEIALWWLDDCVGETNYPCGVEDGIELFAQCELCRT